MLDKEKFSEFYEKIVKIKQEIQKVIVGQKDLITAGLTCLLSGEHLLIEGPPGIGKTKFATVFAKTINAKFKRIAGTPDLLPRDIIGFPMMIPGTNSWVLKKGPIFTNILLFDEINRATPKTKSALLQPMQELSVSIELIEEVAGGAKELNLKEDSLPLPAPFMVLATMNPIDLEGVFPLLEPEKDRFMMKVYVGYPDFEQETKIVQRQSIDVEEEIATIIDSKELLEAKNLIRNIHIDPRLVEMAIRITQMTRPQDNPSLDGFVRLGASPRASMRIVEAARVRAFLEGRTYIVPRDIVSVTHGVLRHRIILERSQKDVEEIISQVLNEVRCYV